MNRLGRIADAVLLGALGVALVVVSVTGDSRFYVRDVMRIPLVLAGATIVAFAVSTWRDRDEHRHTPRSFAFAGIAVAFVLVVRPGPLSVSAGIAFDPSVQARVEQRFEIPPEAVVGPDADPGTIEERAIELHAGQMWFASQQLPDAFANVAIEMVGQVDLDDGEPELVRFRITCCAADALRLTTPLEPSSGGVDDFDAVEPGTWIRVFGRWNGDTVTPGLDVTSWTTIPEPESPYLTIRDA